MMEIEEFLIDLKRVADKVKWIPAEDKMLRATDEQGQTFCPLTLVAFFKNGRRTNVFEAEKAGIRLGLSRDDRWSLILTSDYTEMDLSKLKTKAKFDLRLRHELEEICK